MDRTRKGRAREGRARARAYELLALGFSPPSAEMADAMANVKPSLSLPVFGPLGLEAPDPETLVPEYHRLFVGPESLPAPPYESVYREGWRVMGESTLDVQRQYEEAGYALDPARHDPPDHVTAELAFLALLAEAEAAAWETGDLHAVLSWLRRARAFLDEHLARWVPVFCDRVQASTMSPFYWSLAGLLRDVVRLDLEWSRARVAMLEEALA